MISCYICFFLCHSICISSSRFHACQTLQLWNAFGQDYLLFQKLTRLMRTDLASYDHQQWSRIDSDPRSVDVVTSTRTLHIYLSDDAERTARLSAIIASNLATAYYDDDAIQRTPPLQAKVVKSTPSPEPSFLPPPASVSPPENDRGSRRRSSRRRQRNQPSLGDAVLVGFLANGNRPDLAYIAGEEPLDPDPQRDVSKTPVNGSTDDENEMIIPREDLATDQALAKVAADATKLSDGALFQPSLRRDSTESMKIRPRVVTRSFSPQREVRIFSESNHVKREPSSPGTARNSSAREVRPSGDEDNARVYGSPQSSRPSSSRHDPSSSTADGSSKAISPPLRQYAIPASQGSPLETLPAMQNSPPQSSKPPLGQQTLPGIHAQLGSLADGPPPPNGLALQTRQSFPSVNGSGHSPPKDFTSMRPTNFAPTQPRANGHYTTNYPTTERSPASTLSDASPRETYRPSQDPTSMSPPGTFGSRSYPSNRLTPQSQSDMQTPLSAESQVSASSFSTATSPNDDRMSIDGDRPILPPLQPPNGPPLIGGGFKCDYDGCTAAPFQTQYLLK